MSTVVPRGSPLGQLSIILPYMYRVGVPHVHLQQLNILILWAFWISPPTMYTDDHLVFQSGRNASWHIGVKPDGSIKPPKNTGTGEHGRFSPKVKDNSPWLITEWSKKAAASLLDIHVVRKRFRDLWLLGRFYILPLSYWCSFFQHQLLSKYFVLISGNFHQEIFCQSKCHCVAETI